MLISGTNNFTCGVICVVKSTSDLLLIFEYCGTRITSSYYKASGMSFVFVTTVTKYNAFIDLCQFYKCLL